MIIGENCKPEIQRIRYKRGQLFASRDLRDDSNIAATLRWLHNRALHDAYGVNDGMTVTRVDEYGNPVNEDADFVALVISEGLAYDCFGRELILREPRRIPLPSVPPNVKRMILLIRYKDTATFPKKDAIQGSCISGELSPLSEQPEFLWKPESLVELVDGVPLTRIKYDEKGVPELSEEESQVPISRPLAKLHIASGATIPGNTAWETWDIQGHTSGFEVKIDTSAAGFTRVPCYFAWVQGRLWNRDSGNFFPVVFGHIDEVTATSFTHRLWMPRLSFPTEVYKKLKDRRLINENLKTKFLDFARRQKLFVSWLGIQPPHIDESEVNGESI